MHTYRGIMVFNKSGEALKNKGDNNGAGILQENILSAGILSFSARRHPPLGMKRAQPNE
jgi:hypothetical protein